MSMQSLWKKLNLKDQTEIVILNAPASFEGTISELAKVEVRRETLGNSDLQFFLAFVTRREEIAHLTSEALKNTKGDPIVWFAYPKGSSKRYKCDFNRDNGWEPLSEHGFGGVRQVAIDEDWSALRFRRKEFIKSNGPR